jgi:hypothetical protein
LGHPLGKALHPSAPREKRKSRKADGHPDRDKNFVLFFLLFRKKGVTLFSFLFFKNNKFFLYLSDIKKAKFLWQKKEKLLTLNLNLQTKRKMRFFEILSFYFLC